MKTITVNVSEPVYEEFRAYAAKVDRKTSELIREAMEEYRQQHMSRRTSLRDRRPTSVGGSIEPITREDDILGEMLDEQAARRPTASIPISWWPAKSSIIRFTPRRIGSCGLCWAGSIISRLRRRPWRS